MKDIAITDDPYGMLLISQIDIALLRVAQVLGGVKDDLKLLLWIFHGFQLV